MTESAVRRRFGALLTDALGVDEDSVKRLDKMDWDDLSQLYLALSALHSELPANEERHRHLLELARWLRSSFPLGSDSPSLYGALSRDPRLEQLLKKLHATQNQ